MEELLLVSNRIMQFIIPQSQGGNMVSWAQRAASKRWERRNYDLVTLRVPKGQRVKIREYAATTGESMNSLIRRAIRELMEREKSTSTEI